jgi:hypothetical protein
MSLMLLIVAKVDVQLGTLEFKGFSRPPDPFQIQSSSCNKCGLANRPLLMEREVEYLCHSVDSEVPRIW